MASVRYDPRFAKYYDYLVHGRREALATGEDLAFLNEALLKHGVQGILDVGCGTGRYLIPLAKQGFLLTGIDNSPHMLAQCQARLEKRGLTAHLIELDMMKLQETGQFDAVLCMNSVICYLLQTEAIIKALSLFRNALRSGGLLVLEIWNILANQAFFGSTDTHEICDGEVRIVSTETSRFDPLHSVYHAKLDVTVKESGQTHSFCREEILRAMTVEEVMRYLREAGFVQVTAQVRKDTLEPESQDEELVFLASRAG